MGFFNDVINKGRDAVESVGSVVRSNPVLGAIAPDVAIPSAFWGYVSENDRMDAAGRAAAQSQTNAIINAIRGREQDVQNYITAQNQVITQWIAEQKAQAAAQAEADRIENERANAEFAATKESLKKQSEEFDATKEQKIAGLMAQAGESTRLGLEDQLRQADRMAAARGQFFGGLREGARAALTSNAASDLAAQQVASNELVNSQADAYRALAAANTRQNDQNILGQYQTRAQNAQNAYQQALSGRQQILNQNRAYQNLYGQNTNMINQARSTEQSPESSFMPQLYGAAGTILGAGAQKLGSSSSTPQSVGVNQEAGTAQLKSSTKSGASPTTIVR